jgi:hypothetical protein
MPQDRGGEGGWGRRPGNREGKPAMGWPLPHADDGRTWQMQAIDLRENE